MTLRAVATADPSHAQNLPLDFTGTVQQELDLREHVDDRDVEDAGVPIELEVRAN